MEKVTSSAAHPRIGHVVPVPLLLAVGAILIVLTWVTVRATYVDLGHWNLLIALSIAVIKGSLVALIFMHLRWDRPFNALVLISALVFFAVFIGLSLLDTIHYAPEILPAKAPATGAA
ncbi:MAG: cytochrome C oxidase subunit IV family protein [Planctomycetota bacterium]